MNGSKDKIQIAYKRQNVILYNMLTSWLIDKRQKLQNIEPITSDPTKYLYYDRRFK